MDESSHELRFEHLGQGLFTASSPDGGGATQGSHPLVVEMFVDGPNKRFWIRFGRSRSGRRDAVVNGDCRSIATELHSIGSLASGLNDLGPELCADMISWVVGAYVASDEWTCGRPHLQRCMAVLLRALSLRAVRGGCQRGESKAFTRGREGVCRIAADLRRFSRRVCESGISSDDENRFLGLDTSIEIVSEGLSTLDRHWIAFHAVSETVDHAPSSGRTPEFGGIARMRASYRALGEHIGSIQSALEAEERPGRGHLPDCFWRLFFVEMSLRESLEVLEGDYVDPNGPRPSHSPGMVGLVAAQDLRRVHRLARQLFQLRLRLWQQASAEEQLDPELSLLGVQRPAEDLFAATELFTLRHFKVLETPFRSAVPIQELGNPFFDDAAGSVALERIEARWFDRRCSRMLNRWGAEVARAVIRSDVRESQGSWSRSLRIVADELARDGFTWAGILLLASFLGATLLPSVGLWSVPWGPDPRALGLVYLLIQSVIFLGWIGARQSRGHLPRSFFGTGFIWILTLIPLLEVPAKLSEPLGADASQKAAYRFLLVDPTGPGYWFALVAGAVFSFGLILLQVRGVRRGRRSHRLRFSVHDALAALVPGGVGGRGRRLLGDLIRGLKVTSVAFIGSLWWGSVVLSGALGAGVLPVPDFATVTWAVFPLGIWAVALAFISQLMWQDQFLAEPLGFDR